MKKQTVQMLERLTQIDGVPGFEDDVREFIRSQL